MSNKNIIEKELQPGKGLAILLFCIIGLLAATACFVFSVVFFAQGDHCALGIVLLILSVIGYVSFSILLGGLKVVAPNEARVFTLFGTYYGTIKKPGFHFVNPFCTSFSPAYQAAREERQRNLEAALEQGKGMAATSTSAGGMKKTISLKVQTLDNGRQKVNDVLGNPIIIGAIVIWRVSDPTQAVFAVENYKEYLSIQTDSIIRNTARLYPYDVFEDDEDDGVQEKSLRGSSLEIAENMKRDLSARVADAGLVIEDVRITHLAYAEEIAAAMLQRQQAAAIIAARQKIVDGAVGMVKMAIDKLGEDEVVVLDEERKAAMVSNLLVVLCGNRDAQPIVNSGSIY